MGLSGSRTEPYQNTQGPSGQGATSSPSPKTAIRQHGRGTRRLPGSARTADCQQFLAQRRSHQNTSRTYPSRGDRDSAQTKRLKGGPRNILLQVKYIPLRLAGLASSCASQGSGRRSGNIANCDQRTFQALPENGPLSNFWNMSRPRSIVIFQPVSVVMLRAWKFGLWSSSHENTTREPVKAATI